MLNAMSGDVHTSGEYHRAGALVTAQHTLSVRPADGSAEDGSLQWHCKFCIRTLADLVGLLSAEFYGFTIEDLVVLSGGHTIGFSASTNPQVSCAYRYRVYSLQSSSC